MREGNDLPLVPLAGILLCLAVLNKLGMRAGWIIQAHSLS